MMLHAVVALLPALLFLAILVLMDSFKLARPGSIALAVVCGVAAALVCDDAYPRLQWLAPNPASFSRYVAPVIEETAKGAFIVFFLATGRIGFLVDAGQLGFAVGTGFALVENVQYLRALPDAGLVLWLVRGLGTAVLHGATTAVFAIVSKTASDRRPGRKAFAFVPGWAMAVAIHSTFNHLPLPPLAMSALLLIVLPALVVVVFERSERATREWVVAGLDLDLDLLDLVSSEQFRQTRFGKYLEELRQRFPGPVVTDMFCLLRVELELSVQAKALLMARAAGLTIEAHVDAANGLREGQYLRASIGRTGLLALHPLQVTTDRDAWHRYLLQQ